MVGQVDEVDEGDAENGDAFTWLASGTDATSDAPAGAVFTIAREARDLGEAGDAEAADAAFARAAALADALGEVALLPELVDVVAATLAPLDTTLARPASPVAGQGRRPRPGGADRSAARRTSTRGHARPVARGGRDAGGRGLSGVDGGRRGPSGRGRPTTSGARCGPWAAATRRWRATPKPERCSRRSRRPTPRASTRSGLELEAEARKNLGWTLGDLGPFGEARAALLNALDVLDAAGWPQAADEARDGLDRLPEPHPTDVASA